MGRRIGRTLIGVLAAGGALSAPAGAAPSDSAVGSGINPVGHVSFAAHGGPTPFAPVRGHFTAKGDIVPLGVDDVGDFHFEGPVTCLTVVGNRAGLYYPLKSADPPEFQGYGIFITLTDNGNPSSGVPDQIGFTTPVPAPHDPLVCPPGPTPLELTRGNITIRDVP
jgi:hypothetical protein